MFARAIREWKRAKERKRTKYRERPRPVSASRRCRSAAMLPPAHPAQRGPQTACHPDRTRPEFDVPTKVGVTRTKVRYSPATESMSLPIALDERSSSHPEPPPAAVLASSEALTNHWSVRCGSMGALERSPCGTMCTCFSVRSSKP